MNLRNILNSMPFRRKLLLLFLVIFLPAFGLIVANGISLRQQAIAKAQDNALLLARSLAAQQEQIAIATKTMLRTMALLSQVQNLDAPACTQLFRELHQKYPFYSVILACTPDGNVFAASEAFQPFSVSDRKYFQDVLKSLDFSTGEFIIGRISKVNSLHYAIPVLNVKKKLVAVLIAGFNLHEFGRFLSTVNLPEGSAVVFTDHKGVRIYRLPEHKATPIGKLPLFKGYIDSIPSSIAEGLFEWRALDGVTRINAFKKLRLRENLPPYLYIVVGLPKDAIIHEANLKMLRNLSILGLAALLALSVAWILGNMVIIKPINRLVAATQQFGRGDLDTRTGLPHTHDELGRLAQSFDDMAALLEKRNQERQEAEEALSHACDELEKRVQERTAELSASNQALQLEIDERKQAEAALRQTSETLQTLINVAPLAIYVFDPEGRVQLWNQASERIFGWSREEALGRLPPFIPEDKLEEFASILQRSLKGEPSSRIELTCRKKDGSPVEISLRTAPLNGEHSKVTAVMCISADITERKQAEEALRESEERYRNLVENINLGITLIDSNYRIIMTNVGQGRLFDKPASDFIHKECFREFEKRDAVCSHCPGTRAMATGLPTEAETTGVRDDGSRFPVHLRAFPTFAPDGQANGFIEVVEDITERKQAEAALRESEARFRMLVEHIPQRIFLKDRNSVYITCNYNYARDLGIEVDVIAGKTDYDFHPKELAEKYRADDQRVMVSETVETFEEKYVSLERDYWVRTIKVPVRGEHGNIMGVFGIFEDITERKQAEESLRQAEEKYRSIFENAVEGIFQSTPEGRYIGANPAMARMFGYESPEELMADITDIATQVYVDPQRRADFRRLMAKDGIVKDFEYQIHRKGGGSLWLSENARAVFNEKGDILYFEGFMKDISKRKEAENKLARLRHHQELILNSAWEGILGLDLKGRITFVNLAAARMFGCGAEELLGRDSHSAWHHSKADGSPYPARKCQLHMALKKGEAIYGAEDIFWRQDGTSFPVKYSLAPILEVGEVFEVTGGVLTFWDISQQKEDQALARSLIERSLVGVYLMQDRKFVLTNHWFLNITGYNKKELTNLDPWILVRPEDREEVRTNALKMLRGESFTPYEYRYITKGGETKWVMETVTSVQYKGKRATLGYFMDITDRKQLEEQFLHAQKMEAVGRLAGGVAHDFNNMLAVIMGYAEMMQFGLDAESPLHRQAATIKEASERAASLTRKLLVFSRKQVQETQVLKLNTVISELDKMLRRLIGEDIDLSIELAPDLLPVKADPAQIEQVIMNLVVNARDAMPNGGRITILTANAFLDEAYARKHPDVTPGPYVVIAVSDNGVGMDAETKSHIFEPFFTTKEMGKGTGLGLSTVYGIVKQSQGSIEVYSEPGIGTTFKIYLPQVIADVSKVRTQAPSRPGLQGTETILVAEDEELLRELICETLKRHSYSVLEAKNGDVALALCEGHQGPIHLMLTDVVMPELNGDKLVERGAPMRPEMKVLLMSGYTEDVMIQHGVLDEPIHFLKKPFTTNVLLRKVRELLDTTLEN
jgi:two-component system cell cycle sensor histidine kinase/response regulator CckA